ncbi:MAG: ComEC/Rec2 family competence protein [Pirellulales bacterium]|nr:ComEC/Rec2 family competence protein [Pirellulales bacterium]
MRRDVPAPVAEQPRAPSARERAARRALEPASGYQPLVLLAAAVASGIVFDRWGTFSFGFWLALGTLLGASWWHSRRAGQDQRAACVLLLSAAALSGAWHHACWRLFDVDEISRFTTEVAQPVCLEAIAASTPTRVPAPPFDPLRALPSGESTRLDVIVTELRDRDVWRRGAGRATLIVEGHLLGVRSGDRLRIFGQLAGPAPVLNPGQFDFASFARGDRQMALIRTDHPDAVTRIAPGTRTTPAAWLDAWRRQASSLVWQHVGAERAGLESALLLGTRQQLSREQLETFLHTGTLDVLAISGMHVALLAWVLFLALRWALVPQRLGLIAIALVTVLYALLTGGEPPVVRATVLVLVVCLGMGLARQPLALNSLAAGALLVLAINPVDLFRAGAQLSFLAVCVLAWITPRVVRWPRLDPLARLIVETRPWPQRMLRASCLWTVRTLTVSTVIWLVMLPLILTRFHVVSPIGIVLHPLLMLPVGVALISGFALLALGWIATPLAAALGAICNVGLAITDRLVRWGEAVPGGHFYAAGPYEWWMIGAYGGFAAWAMLGERRPPGRWCLALTIAWLGIGFGAAAVERTGERALRCSFVAVGHGTAVVIELPSGETLLYDAGRLGSPAGATRDVSGVLWERGIGHLDGLVVSHADVDHFNGVPGLVERFSCGSVFAARPMIAEGSLAVKTLWGALEAHGIALREVRAGDRLQNRSGAVLEVWHPPVDGILGSDNANSIVLAIEYAGRRILLTGDLETPGLEAVLAEAPYDTDVLLAPHHGSPRSDPPGMIAWSSPEHVVISGGYDEQVAGVAQTYAASGAQVLHTAVVGAVTVSIFPGPDDACPGRLTVETHRLGNRPGSHYQVVTQP